MAAEPHADIATLSFEKALAELEGIVCGRIATANSRQPN